MILSLAIIVFMVLLNLMLMIDLLNLASYNLEIYFAIAATFSDLIFMSGFLATFYIPKCRKSAPSPQQRIPCKEASGMEYGTFKESDRVSALSHTDFQVQFTGEFTSISTPAS